MTNNLDKNSYNFGDLLKQARLDCGFDIDTLARRLHIRNDIVEAIENGDVNNMPASGYARNMVRAYARTVGLNQNEICEMYLSEVRETENSYSPTIEHRENNNHSTSIRSYNSVDRCSRRHSFSQLIEKDDNKSVNSSISHKKELSSISYFSNNNKKNTNFSRTKKENISRQASLSKQKNRREKPPTRHIPTKSMSSSFSLGGLPKPSIPQISSKNILAILVSIILIILIIVIVVLLLKPSQKQVDDVPNMPISGLTDTSNAENKIETNTTLDLKSVKFEFSVAKDQLSWITVEMDGEQKYADVATGPITKSFDVTGTLDFSTANPTPVTCKLNDKQVELTADTSTGFYTYSVDFNKWYEENKKSQ